MCYQYEKSQDPGRYNLTALEVWPSGEGHQKGPILGRS